MRKIICTAVVVAAESKGKNVRERKTLMRLAPGMKIKTCMELGSTLGMAVWPGYLDARQANQAAVLKGAAAGHGGDVWYARHEGTDQIAVYSLREMALLGGENDETHAA